MGKAIFLSDPTYNIFGNLLQVVIMLIWQYDDQLKNGLPWMQIHIDHRLSTKKMFQMHM